MRSFLVLVVSILPAFGCDPASEQSTPAGKSDIVVLSGNSKATVEVDAGIVPYGAKRDFTVTVLNETDADRTFAGMQRTCGCTVLDDVPQVFVAKRKTFLTGSVLASRPEREVNESIKITLSDGSLLDIRVHAQVLLLTEPKVDLGEFSNPEGVEKSIEIKVPSGGNVVNLNYPSRFLKVVPTKATLGNTQIRIYPADNVPTGRFNAELRGRVIGANNEFIGELSTVVSGIRKSRLEIEPKTVTWQPGPDSTSSVNLVATTVNSTVGEIKLASPDFTIENVRTISTSSSATRLEFSIRWKVQSSIGIITVSTTDGSYANLSVVRQEPTQ